MISTGQTGTYVSATGPINLPTPRRRKHRTSQSRPTCPTCALPLVRADAFHVCLDLTQPEPVVVKAVKVKKAKKGASRKGQPRIKLTPEERIERRRERDRIADKRKRAQAGWKCIEGCGETTSREGVRCRACRHKLAPSIPSRVKPHLDTIRARYEAGEKVIDIAADYGVTAQRIRRALREEGVEARPRSRVFGAGDLAELISMYENGVPMKAVADHFKVAQATVIKHLDATGVKRRPAGRPRKDAA